MRIELEDFLLPYKVFENSTVVEQTFRINEMNELKINELGHYYFEYTLIDGAQNYKDFCAGKEVKKEYDYIYNLHTDSNNVVLFLDLEGVLLNAADLKVLPHSCVYTPIKLVFVFLKKPNLNTSFKLVYNAYMFNDENAVKQLYQNRIYFNNGNYFYSGGCLVRAFLGTHVACSSVH